MTFKVPITADCDHHGCLHEIIVSASSSFDAAEKYAANGWKVIRGIQSGSGWISYPDNSWRMYCPDHKDQH